jgi:hypothetical protein
MKLVRLIEICVNERYCKFHIDKHLSDNFPIQNGLKQGDGISPLLVHYFLRISSEFARHKHFFRILLEHCNPYF